MGQALTDTHNDACPTPLLATSFLTSDRLYDNEKNLVSLLHADARSNSINTLALGRFSFPRAPRIGKNAWLGNQRC